MLKPNWGELLFDLAFSTQGCPKSVKKPKSIFPFQTIMFACYLIRKIVTAI